MQAEVFLVFVLPGLTSMSHHCLCLQYSLCSGSFYHMYTKSSTSDKFQLPPGPTPWPVIGNILHIMGEEPYVAMTKFAKVYEPLILLKLGSQLYIVGSSPMAAAEILKTRDRLLSGRTTRQASPPRGNGLEGFSIIAANECTETWKFLRTLCRSELFSGRAIELQASLREKKTEEMVEYLRTMEGNVVSIRETLYTTVLNTVSNMLLSQDMVLFGSRRDTCGFKKKISRIIELHGIPNIGDLYPVLGKFDIQGLRKKTTQLFHELAEVWQPFLRERRLKYGHGEQEHRPDFLDAFLANNFSDDQIKIMFNELLLAGSDTTTTVVEWAMAELIKNGEAMKKLREELKEAVDDGEKRINESQISRTPYLQACIKETLRLHPPAPLFLPHRAVESCKIMNFQVPKNSNVIVNFWAISRDPSLWEEPLIFKPERFIGSNIDFKGKDYEYLPFGSGRRMCPGLPMAAKLAPLMLASMVAFFDWYLPSVNDPAQLDMTETLRVGTLMKEQPLLIVPKCNS